MGIVNVGAAGFPEFLNVDLGAHVGERREVQAKGLVGRAARRVYPPASAPFLLAERAHKFSLLVPLSFGHRQGNSRRSHCARASQSPLPSQLSTETNF